MREKWDHRPRPRFALSFRTEPSRDYRAATLVVYSTAEYCEVLDEGTASKNRVNFIVEYCTAQAQCRIALKRAIGNRRKAAEIILHCPALNCDVVGECTVADGRAAQKICHAAPLISRTLSVRGIPVGGTLTNSPLA